MKNNQYTQWVSNIKAPQNLIDNSVDKVWNKREESEVIFMKKSHRGLKLVSSLAAVLALVIAVSAVSFRDNGDTPTSRSFMLTVNAAESADAATPDEITRDTYVKIGELRSFSNASHMLMPGYLDENRNWVITSTDRYVLGIMKEFNMPIQCVGEDIESITYTSNNCVLAYNSKYEGFMGATQLTEEEVVKYDASGGSDGYLWTKSCTFDYNCQPKSSLDFELEEDCVDGTIPLRMGINFKFEKGDYIIYKGENDENTLDPYENEEKALNDIFLKEFTAHASEFSLDVTANFTDGTTSTKTLTFKCEYEGNVLYMYAKEI